MGEEPARTPEHYTNNSQIVKELGNAPSVEARVPLRTETINKQGYSLEKRFYTSFTANGINPVEITIIQGGERKDIKTILEMEADTVIFEDPSISAGLEGCGVNSETKSIAIPRYVFLSPDQPDFYGLKKTEMSLQRNVPIAEGKVIEIHDFLGLRGSLLHLDHEDGHIKYAKHISPEELARIKAIITKVNQSKPNFKGMTPEDAKEYTETVLSSESGAWIEAIVTYNNSKKKYDFDISDGMDPKEIMKNVHNCLESYERIAEKLKTATQNSTE